MGRRHRKIRWALAGGFSLCCLLAILFAMLNKPSALNAQSREGQIANPGEIKVQQTTVRVQGPVRGPLLKSPPAERPERPEHEEEEGRQHPTVKVPIDPRVHPEDIRPTNAETVIRLAPKELLETPRRAAAPQAPETFTFFQNITTGDKPALPGGTAPTYSPYEPSVGVNGRVVFYTTNNYTAVSGDRGQTYSYINPNDNFPADGTVDAVNGGFGGDQHVYYERRHGLMCWLIQYSPDNATNTYRLAIARSQADVLNNTWYWYDITPATFNLATPPGAQGIWLDFPVLTVSDNLLYFSANYFPRRTTSSGCMITCPGTCPATCTGGCTGCGSLGAVIARISLDQLAQAGTIGVGYFIDPFGSSLALTHGTHDVMYWGKHISNTQLRVYSWPENGNITPHDVNHTAYNGPGRGGHIATCAGGTNYLAYDDERILAAWVANGVIGFMWNAAQGGGFLQPHVWVLRINESNLSFLSEGQIYNNSYAFAYPSVHPNDRGHLGGTIAFGCGGNSGSPGLAAWIADDFNNGTITPLENLGVVSGNRAEARWGDYFHTRIYSPFGNTWVGTGFVLNSIAGNSNQRDHRFVWFGRERDTPPATNTIFVSLLNTSGYEDGTFLHPFSKVSKANFAAMPGDVISIVSGNFNERPVLDRPSRLQRFGNTGSVIVGRP